MMTPVSPVSLYILIPTNSHREVDYSQHVHIERSVFLSGLWGYGVVIGNASGAEDPSGTPKPDGLQSPAPQGCSVQGCLFDGVGQGGVLLFGFDASPAPGNNGSRAAGNNTQPRNSTVSFNVMQSIGGQLIHVAGVSLRSASNSTVAHNRVRGTPRYGREADSFNISPIQNSRFHTLEFNILSDTNRLTTDTGAIEMLGSGKPGSVANGTAPWYMANLVRHNNISATQGSSSSDGKHVCVHGVPDEGCRRLVWGVYLDGGASGATIYGNIIGATLRGAIFDNAGGNNTHENNIFVGEADGSSRVLMDFGSNETVLAPRAVSGSLLKRNIFYFHNASIANKSVWPAMLASQIPWSNNELKDQGSDFNVFWTPSAAARSPESSWPIFPEGQTLEQWQGTSGKRRFLRCGDSTFTVVTSTSANAPRWSYNETDRRFYAINYAGTTDKQQSGKSVLWQVINAVLLLSCHQH